MIVTKMDCDSKPNLIMENSLVTALERCFLAMKDSKFGHLAIRVLNIMAEYDHTLDGIVECDRLTPEERLVETAITCAVLGYNTAKAELKNSEVASVRRIRPEGRPGANDGKINGKEVA